LLLAIYATIPRQRDLQIHTQKAVAIPLPAALKSWLPNKITTNKIAAHAIIRDNQGILWLSLVPIKS
jgi:hypothetical protein